MEATDVQGGKEKEEGVGAVHFQFSEPTGLPWHESFSCARTRYQVAFWEQVWLSEGGVREAIQVHCSPPCGKYNSRPLT